MKDYRTKQEQFKVDFVKVSNAADFLNLLFFFLLLMVLPSKRAAQKHKKTNKVDSGFLLDLYENTLV
jgi:hypothetical protein